MITWGDRQEYFTSILLFGFIKVCGALSNCSWFLYTSMVGLIGLDRFACLVLKRKSWMNARHSKTYLALTYIRLCVSLVCGCAVAWLVLYQSRWHCLGLRWWVQWLGEHGWNYQRLHADFMSGSLVCLHWGPSDIQCEY